MFQNSQNADARGATFHDVGRDHWQIHSDQVNISQVITHTEYGYTSSSHAVIYSSVPRYLTSDSDTLALLDPVPDDTVYNSINAVSGCLAGTRQGSHWTDHSVDRWKLTDKPMCCGYMGQRVMDLESRRYQRRSLNCAPASNRLAGSFFFPLERGWTPKQDYPFHIDTCISSCFLRPSDETTHRACPTKEPSYHSSVSRIPVPEIDH